MGNSESVSSKQKSADVRAASPGIDNVETHRIENLNDSYQDVRVVSPHYQQSGVDRDNVMENVQRSKEERMQMSTERRSLRRRSKIDERRKSSRSPEASTKPNPMSYANAAFSVEPKHPEQKRSYESNSVHDEDFEPEEKRFRPSDEPDQWSPATKASAIAVIAMTVAFALQYFKKK